MMLEIIHNIVTTLVKDNNIFGENGFYQKDLYEFGNGGISDININQFYIRPLNLNPKKHRLVGKEQFGINLLLTQYRAVFQLKEVDSDKAMNSLVYQISKFDDVQITSFSDDATGIYYAEYKKDKTPPGVVISVDFEISEETGLQQCDCLNIEEC